MKIAMVSDHASPLAQLGGADACGRNVHVAELSSAMARRGRDVTVSPDTTTVGEPVVCPSTESFRP